RGSRLVRLPSRGTPTKGNAARATSEGRRGAHLPSANVGAGSGSPDVADDTGDDVVLLF
ncbi:hypothetical protein ALC57_04945, partial [Trachymyrmex cornetzi]